MLDKIFDKKNLILYVVDLDLIYTPHVVGPAYRLPGKSKITIVNLVVIRFMVCYTLVLT